MTKVARDLKLGENDRSNHELEVLLNVLELCGSYDQCNLPNMAAIELVCRRVQLILDASGGQAPAWEGAEHYLGLGRRAKCIVPIFADACGQQVEG